MIRPKFNRFGRGDPEKDFNNAMKHYLIYLEGRNQICFGLESVAYNAKHISENYHRIENENIELKKTLKILRSQIKTMFKEGGPDGSQNKEAAM